MWTLGFDCAVSTVSVAILKDHELAAHYDEELPSSHSVSLLPTIASLLKQLNITINDVNLISCSAGPGSFTGVRIGVATAKGLGTPASIPCIGVSSLEALASSLDSSKNVICPVIGARRGNVYSALFNCGSIDCVSRITNDDLIPISELPSLCYQSGIDSITVIGDAAKDVRSLLKDRGLNIELSSNDVILGGGYGAALSGYRTFISSKGRLSEWSPSLLKPVYLRKSQAEQERDRRILQKNN